MYEYHQAKAIGALISRLRRKRKWEQDLLVVKLQVLGCNITREHLNSVETGRFSLNDIQIEFCCEVFGDEMVRALIQSLPGPFSSRRSSKVNRTSASKSLGP